MNLFEKRLITDIRIAGFCFLAAVISGCSSEDLKKDVETYSPKVYVAASMAEVVSSRASQEVVDVTSGKYFLSYPQETSLEYALGTVDFDLSVTPGIGFVLLPDNEEMTWEKVGGNMPTFYLDNVSPEDGVEATGEPMTLDLEDGGRFKAGIFDSTDGSNDLLWGEVQVYNNTRTLNFQLHHNMARLVVEITVDKTFEIDGDLDLSDATVTLSSINQVPLSYNRSTGFLTLPNDESDYTELTLVNSETEWGSTVGQDQDITVYTTQDFVLPPQDLLTDENRPRLTITLSNGRIFSGIVPYAMNVVDSEHESEYPVTLSFLKEHILVLRTLVSNQPPELIFMPVWVMEWVDKGVYDVTGHQAGIYLVSEFDDMIRYYQAGNEFQLNRYGNLVNGTWSFNIWSSLVLDYDAIRGKMEPGGEKQKNYRFIYNNYTIQVYSGNVYKNVTATQLVQILSGNLAFVDIP